MDENKKIESDKIESDKIETKGDPLDPREDSEQTDLLESSELFEPPDHSDIDPTLEIEVSQLKDAGSRASRRVRRGRSLALGSFFTLLVALVPGVAIAVLYFLSADPIPVGSSATVLPQTGPSVLLRQVTEQLTAVSQQNQKLCTALATAIVRGADALSPAEEADAAAVKEQKRKWLRAGLESAQGEHAGTRAVLLNSKQEILFAVGDLKAQSPALKSAVTTVLQGSKLPDPLVAGSAETADGAFRVVFFTAVPRLEQHVLDDAKSARRQTQQSLIEMSTLVEAGSAALEVQREQQQLVVGLALGGTFLLLVVLWFGVLGPQRQSLQKLLARTSIWATGNRPDPDEVLVKELATLDDMMASAFEMAQLQSQQALSRSQLEEALTDLAEVTTLAAKGDLSQRAKVGPGAVGTLAMAINLLVEDFEKRALRLRSHAVGQPLEQQQEASPSDTMAQLQQRSKAIAPISQLLGEIAGKLRVINEDLTRGEKVEADIGRLAEAVASRSKKARAFLGALAEAISALEQRPASSTRLATQIEQELKDLTLDSSFIAKVDALRDLGSEEIGKRLKTEAEKET